MALTVALSVELTKNLLGQHLAQLNAPLVKAVDVPDGTLGKGEVLVVDDERTELRRANVATDKDRCGRSVAQESLVGDKLLRGTLSSNLVVSLADHQSLGLRKVVGSQHLLVEIVRDRVVRLGRKDKVGGDQLGALVDELEEGVLSVGAGLAKEDGACRC